MCEPIDLQVKLTVGMYHIITPVTSLTPESFHRDIKLMTAECCVCFLHCSSQSPPELLRAQYTSVELMNKSPR